MKIVIVTILASLLCFTGLSQTNIARRVIIQDSLSISGRWIRAFDTTYNLASNSHSTIPTTKAIRQFIQNNGGSMSGWGLNGNSGTNPNTQFIGTTDGQPVVFKLNGKRAGLIDSANTSVYFGFKAGNPANTFNLRNVIMGHEAGMNGGGGNLVVIGNQACRDCGIDAGELVAIGNWSQLLNIDGWRNVTVGQSTLFRNLHGHHITATGTFAAECNLDGNFLTANGFSALRSNRRGSFSTANGVGSLQFNTTSVGSITVNSGGSGYTTASVVISPPNGMPSPGGQLIQATAVAIINNESISAVIVTDPGAGYESATATISGNGTGASITANLASGSFNTGDGASTLIFNRIGSFLTASGFEAGYGDGGNEASLIDDSCTFIGFNSSRHSSVPQLTRLVNATALGANSKIGQSNAVSIGGNGAIVGIGTPTPNTSAMLDVVSTTKGFLPPRMTATQRLLITSPAPGLIVYDTDSSRLFTYSGAVWQKMITIQEAHSGSFDSELAISQGQIINANVDVDGDKAKIRWNNGVWNSRPYIGSNGGRIDIQGDNGGTIRLNPFSQGSNVIMVPANNGNVGINTDSPADKLDVNGNVSFLNLKIRSKAGDPSTSDIPDGYWGVWKNTTTNAVRLWTNDSGVMRSVSF